MNLENYFLDNNYIATFPGNFSSDPNICLIPYQPISPDITKPFRLPDTTVNKILKQGDFFTVDDNSLIGRMMNIYINIGFIIKTFNSSINENDEVILIEFLKNVLSGVNNSLGGLNDFRIIHNKDTNLFEIRSEVNLNIKPKSLPHTINTFGVPKDNGSFVREVDFNSELTNKYATMLSIGAQADGNISQNNSTAFSIYNKGLVDRVIKEKVDTTRTSEDDKKNKIEDLFTKDIEKCFEEVYNFKKFTNDNTSVLSNINSQYCKLASGKLTQIKKSLAPFFLPFNLSLTMDGLSGMKIYQSFKVDGKALPLTYDTNVIQLIITSLSHDVSPNGWLTKLETLAGPIFEVLPSLATGTYAESGQIETPSTNPALSNVSINPNQTFKNLYIPTLNQQIPNAKKGIRLLMEAQASFEGFSGPSKSNSNGTLAFRTNNPGNIGNTDAGGKRRFDTLALGIQGQYNHINRVALGQEPNYPLNKRKIAPGATDKATGITYPGIDFIYTGQLQQYLKIYATGPRRFDNYLNYVISYFKKNGINIAPTTTLKEIYDIV
jgi:hypothetical protein